MIQRYGLFGAYDDWKMEPDSDGEFVLFSDHVAEVERKFPPIRHSQNQSNALPKPGWYIETGFGSFYVMHVADDGSCFIFNTLQDGLEAWAAAALQDRPTPTEGGAE